MPPPLFSSPPPLPVPLIFSTTTTITAINAAAASAGRLAMAINLRSHAFAGSPLRDPKHPSPLQTLKDLALDDAQPNLRVLPFAKGRPLAVSLSEEAAAGDAEPRPLWHLGWLTAEELRTYLGRCGVALGEVGLVYLGSKDRGPSYWAAEVPAAAAEAGSPEMEGGGRSCFVELRTLMVATDWTDEPAMGELAVAGRGKALLEWHNTARFCGHCGAPTKPIDAGRRKQCTNELCKKRVYPRVDPVVIMLVIDKENDRALLSHQSRFVPRMWSCLAGFMEPGESLEEAVRRETLEETGIEVDEVVYHSSQPWPVGPNSMPCQLMVGFFAYAKTLEISVDKDELEDAQWHRREDVKKALTFTEYKKAQTTAAAKVDQMCKGVERKQSLSSDFNVESGELAPMFVPGPFAIAHHLIFSWVYQINPDGDVPQPKQGGSVSNL